MRSVLVDSGIFIALFDANDRHHTRCRDFLAEFRGRLLTTWPVVTEALAMLNLGSQLALLTWIERGVANGLLRVVCTEEADLPALRQWTMKYRDQPMDFADASVYALAIRTGIREVLSVDFRDFGVYRLPGNKTFQNLFLADPH